MVKTTGTILMLKAILANPINKVALSEMSKYCDEDHGHRLDVALELYVGGREHACLRCRLAEKPLRAILAAGGRAFGVGEDELKNAFKDPYWRKGLVSVIRGMHDFGVRRPFVPGAPFQVVWDVTYACNLRCRHCYASAGQARPDELSTAEALNLIDRLSTWGVPILAFSGGEPLVRPDILELIARAKAQGMYVALATNATLLTKEKAAELKEAGAQYLQISLDGAKAATHDGLRGIDGAFDRTIKGIKNAVDEGFFVNISSTITQNNLDEVSDMIDLCTGMGVNWFMAYNFIPAGRGVGMSDLDLTPEQRESLLELLYRKNQDGKCQVLTTAPQFARVALQQQCQGETLMVPTHFYNQKVSGGLVGLTEFVGGCGAGRFYVAVRANGDIDPCVFFPRTVANVRDVDLEELWKNDHFLQQLRDKDLLEGNCGSCDYRYHCGGCRARAYGYFGDHLAPDPGCVRNRSAYDKIAPIVPGSEKKILLSR
jgi:radical SAM protein with 4Fe4S-binding SPASM domain